MMLNNIKNIVGLIFLILTLIITGCTNNDDIENKDITGTYYGTLTNNLLLKSVSDKSNSATVVVKKVGEEIEIHCLNGDFEYSMMLNYFNDGDIVRACLTGENFENTYGHMLGYGNNMGSHMQGSSSEWMQHLSLNHQDNESHFGHFNMHNNTFECSFEFEGGQYSFQGKK